MNIRCIVFSGVLTSLVGVVLGMALFTINQDDRSQGSTPYTMGGAILGLLVGSSQEALRQKAREESEEF